MHGSRRDFLHTTAGAAVVLGISIPGWTAEKELTAQTPINTKGNKRMSTITTKDGTTIYYKDWGPKTGPVITFSHGWPLSSDAWESQMFFLASQGFRCIGHDRRGHGRSSQPWDGNHMDQYADDLAELFEKLDLKSVMMVGHSTGGGEVARYIGRHGTKGAVDSITRSLAKELGPRGIRVNAINPGMVETEGTHSAGIAESEMRKQVEAQTPLGRIGKPQDIAGAAVFLASADSSWITGETFVISGGNR